MPWLSGTPVRRWKPFPAGCKEAAERAGPAVWFGTTRKAPVPCTSAQSHYGAWQQVEMRRLLAEHPSFFRDSSFPESKTSGGTTCEYALQQVQYHRATGSSGVFALTAQSPVLHGTLSASLQQACHSVNLEAPRSSVLLWPPSSSTVF